VGPAVARLENTQILKGVLRGGLHDPHQLPDHYLDELRRVGRRPGYPTVARAIYRTRDLGVSKPTISRHLKTLEEAEVVSRVIAGRNHRLALRPDTLAEASGWIASQCRRWEALFDAVGEFLEERADQA
jgi:DNA-binding transcriptional ArsR family regulator